MDTTAPKPYVFVLMPFSKNFDNVYKLAVKQAADAAGGFALRLDEQMYGEGMLERIYMEIGKADVLVADMTGHNPNVFYEVGYSHALNKVTLLITQNADDIPFDLKHRPHIIYNPDDLAGLVAKLDNSLRWGIQEARNRGSSKLSDSFRVFVGRMSSKYEAIELNTIYYRLGPDCQRFQVQFLIKNESSTSTARIHRSYIFVREQSKLVPHFSVLTHAIPMDESFSGDGLNLGRSLDYSFDPIPPGATQHLTLQCIVNRLEDVVEPIKLRLCTDLAFHDFRFNLGLRRGDVDPAGPGFTVD